jgi:hypothetical protein
MDLGLAPLPLGVGATAATLRRLHQPENVASTLLKNAARRSGFV